MLYTINHNNLSPTSGQMHDELKPATVWTSTIHNLKISRSRTTANLSFSVSCGPWDDMQSPQQNQWQWGMVYDQKKGFKWSPFVPEQEQSSAMVCGVSMKFLGLCFHLYVCIYIYIYLSISLSLTTCICICIKCNYVYNCSAILKPWASFKHIHTITWPGNS